MAELVPSNHARVGCRRCSSMVYTVQRGGVGPAFFPRCPYCGDDDPAGELELPARRYGAVVHAAVVVAGVVGLLIRWRRPGGRWVL